MTNNMRTRDIRRMILIGLIVALVSQLYWNIFINNFRISSSVIILPVLLMTLGKSLSTPLTCDRSHRVLLPPVSGAPQRDQSPRLSEKCFSECDLLFLLRYYFRSHGPGKTYRLLQPPVSGRFFC